MTWILWRCNFKVIVIHNTFIHQNILTVEDIPLDHVNFGLKSLKEMRTVFMRTVFNENSADYSENKWGISLNYYKPCEHLLYISRQSQIH